jgi:uncharacterized protein
MREATPVLAQCGDDVLVTLRVRPNVSREAISVEPGGLIRVALTAPPVEGAANKALIAVLAKGLDVAKRRVVIEQGAKSRDKVVRIRNATVQAIQQRLE